MDLVRRQLNRATATSVDDHSFVSETRLLAASHPAALLQGCIACACLDVEQAELIHKLLSHIPELMEYCTEGGKTRPLLHQCLRASLLHDASPACQDALLLLIARLTEASEQSTQLVSRDALLADSILPALRIAAPHHGPPLQLVLRAALQLLNGRAENLTAQQLPSLAEEAALDTIGLAALLAALLDLLERRAQLVTEAQDLLLRCTHTSVQLLLPRAEITLASLYVAACASSQDP